MNGPPIKKPRRRGKHIAGKRACCSMRIRSPLAKETLSPINSLKRIFECQFRDEVIDLVNTVVGPEDDQDGIEPQMAYYAFRLKTDSVPKINKNIEFRQHIGSLDREAITNWAKICVGLVEYARTTLPGALRTFLLEHVDDAYSALDLFKHIGLGAQAAYYRRAKSETATLGE